MIINQLQCKKSKAGRTLARFSNFKVSDVVEICSELKKVSVTAIFNVLKENKIGNQLQKKRKIQADRT